MSTEVADLFDVERMAADPNTTYLSVQGAETVLYWRDILEEKNYFPFRDKSHRDIYAAAGYLIANEHTDLDLMTVAIMLTFIS